MKMRICNWVRLATGCLSLAVVAGGCAGSPEDINSPSGAEPAQSIHVYWTESDGQNNVVTRDAMITPEQKKALLAARKASLANGSGPSIKPSIKHTVSSTDWQSACQYYSWILLTSGTDGSGDIFCATFVDEPGARIAYIPFVPHWYDGSTDYWGYLCTGTNYCWVGDSCAVKGPDVWPDGTLYTSGGGNFVNPPSSLHYICVAYDCLTPC